MQCISRQVSQSLFIQRKFRLNFVSPDFNDSHYCYCRIRRYKPQYTHKPELDKTLGDTLHVGFGLQLCRCGLDCRQFESSTASTEKNNSNDTQRC
mmetsp:Transcript_19205/g.47078  ORF Transcript_19205/g.47078 Transcript_19205/m.47078 type:complete len:95 (-) Transcript_19205:707-991(-)